MGSDQDRKYQVTHNRKKGANFRNCQRNVIAAKNEENFPQFSFFDKIVYEFDGTSTQNGH